MTPTLATLAALPLIAVATVAIGLAMIKHDAGHMQKRAAVVRPYKGTERAFIVTTESGTFLARGRLGVRHSGCERWITDRGTVTTCGSYTVSDTTVTVFK